MFRSLLTAMVWYLRPLMKWFLRKTTRLCELQRVCYGEKPGATRSLGVEKSLLQSRSGDIKNLIVFLDSVSDGRKFTGTNKDNVVQYSIYVVLRVKRINPQIQPQLSKSFAKCI